MRLYSYRPSEPPAPPAEDPPPRADGVRARLKQYLARAHSALLVLLGVLLAFTLMVIYDATQPPPQRLTQRDIHTAVARALASATPPPSIAAQVYAIIAPSLVRIEGSLPGTGQRVTIGTGTVIDDFGHILSSLHIVERATAIQVTFFDGSESPAVIVGRDPARDLVLLRASILPDNLVPATLGNSDMLRVGDEAIVVGNPFGITNSLSAGVISGLQRRFRSPRTGATLDNMIQFDAAVNPGNSGGPLLNRYGEVVGIVTGLLNPTDQEVFIGIGFAVPIETAAAAVGAPEY